jgi:hypothetical protein
MVVELGAQRVALGLHSPTHAPSEQKPEQGDCGWLAPMASHRTGVSFVPQLRVPGSQDPVHAVLGPLPLQTEEQVVVSRQTPERSHFWIADAEGLHR